jgi:hypothetical protein
MSNRQDESHINVSDDFLDDTLSSSFRSLSTKRLRDPTNRKSVSFNDVPIVYEVPSYDTMRNSNNDIYRSWTCADATLPFPSSQILLPFNSTSASAQKIHAHRLSSSLYSSSTLNRLSDWPLRTKTAKTFEETTEHHTISNPPSIMVHRSDEQIISSENNEEKKHLYRSTIIPDFEHHKILPFTYVPLSESTTTYTSMLTTNLIQSNDQNPNGHTTRTARALSATLPVNVTNTSARNNDNISIIPLRTTTNISSSRTVLKPATIGFHGSTSSPILLTTNTSISKPPTIPPRSNTFAGHSRLISSSTRPLSSTNKHITYSTTLTRSRSANISSSKHNIASPIVMLDGQSTGTTHHNNLYTTTKRNPNVRQTYGSYIHHALLPADIN